MAISKLNLDSKSIVLLNGNFGEKLAFEKFFDQKNISPSFFEDCSVDVTINPKQLILDNQNLLSELSNGLSNLKIEKTINPFEGLSNELRSYLIQQRSKPKPDFVVLTINFIEIKRLIGENNILSPKQKQYYTLANIVALDKTAIFVLPIDKEIISIDSFLGSIEFQVIMTEGCYLPLSTFIKNITLGLRNFSFGNVIEEETDERITKANYVIHYPSERLGEQKSRSQYIKEALSANW